MHRVSDKQVEMDLSMYPRPCAGTSHCYRTFFVAAFSHVTLCAECVYLASLYTTSPPVFGSMQARYGIHCDVMYGKYSRASRHQSHWFLSGICLGSRRLGLLGCRGSYTFSSLQPQTIHPMDSPLFAMPMLQLFPINNAPKISGERARRAYRLTISLVFLLVCEGQCVCVCVCLSTGSLICKLTCIHPPLFSLAIRRPRVFNCVTIAAKSKSQLENGDHPRP